MTIPFPTQDQKARGSVQSDLRRACVLLSELARKETLSREDYDMLQHIEYLVRLSKERTAKTLKEKSKRSLRKMS